jgi:DNA polymerase-3 subunit gamma/tau
VSYLVLARKYRPQSFDDLVGQEHVATTLANAIAQGRVAHAFLFTGVRGVGKTTSARLLAKCLNCLGADGTAKGATATPCQTCSACKEIAAGMDIDVQEIDGASYNGVDEVRRLQEGLAFRPARDRFKIYIVDEVHMLSTAAWNAFLKTLEEPPPHVKFIFATTEVHKVPVTILSRCQRYDFKLIPTQVIAKCLEGVLAKEKLSAEGAAVSVLAREAAGSMRDAMSLLDQVIAYGGERLTGEDVARVLGVASRKVLHDLAAALVGGEPARALGLVGELAQQGFDLAHVAKDLLHHLRNLVVAKVCGDARRELLDLADEEVADVVALAEKSDADDLVRLFQGFSKSFDDILKSGQPRAALEMTLVRLARRPPLLPLDELLGRLGDLERRLGGASPTPSARGGGGSTRSSRQTSAEPGPSFGTFAPPTVVDRTPKDFGGGGGGGGTRASAATGVATGVAPMLRPEEATPLPPSTTRETAPASSAPVVRLVPAPDAPSLDRFRELVGRIRPARPHLAALLEQAFVLEIGPGCLRIGFEPGNFAGGQVQEPAERAVLDVEARALLGPGTAVTVDTNVRRTAASVTLAALERERKQAALAEARGAVEKHPLVQKVIKLFDAELRDIKVPEGD